MSLKTNLLCPLRGDPRKEQMKIYKGFLCKYILYSLRRQFIALAHQLNCKKAHNMQYLGNSLRYIDEMLYAGRQEIHTHNVLKGNSYIFFSLMIIKQGIFWCEIPLAIDHMIIHWKPREYQFAVCWDVLGRGTQTQLGYIFITQP